MGYLKNKQREGLEHAWDEEPKKTEVPSVINKNLGSTWDEYKKTSEYKEVKENLSAIMKELDKQERLNLIEYYITVTMLGLISLGLGFMLGSILV